MKAKTSLQFRLFGLGLLPSIPLVGLIVYQKYFGSVSEEAFSLLAFLYLAWLVLHIRVFWRACCDPFYTLANLVRSLHQGDFGQRIKTYPKNDVIGFLHDEINTLADVLQNNRFAAVESLRRFQYLIDQLDIGVVVFDEQKRLTMINAPLARLFGRPPSKLLDCSLSEMSLDPLWNCESGRTLWLELPEKNSRFLIHTSSFREEGRPQRLFLLTDVKNPLREEERTAWKRLIRVLGHELNNSLTPIISLSQSLKSRIGRLDVPEDKKQSSIEALEMIAERAKGLNRFVDDYSKLAKLPDPERREISLHNLLRGVAQFLNRSEIECGKSEDLDIFVDPDQIEQMFINLVRNALEAIPEEGGSVLIHWARENMDAIVYIDDNGPGFEKGENLFVPFYSTKPGGSGIGLVLSQQIAESNGCSVALSNRPEGGCRATVKLPLHIT